MEEQRSLVSARKRTAASGAETVRAVERAARIIKALAERPYSMTVRELAARVDQSPTSVHRMLTTLTAIGWAHQNTNTGRYRLGSEILGIGSSGLITDPLVQNGRMFLQRFTEATGHTSFLSTLVGSRVVYLAKVEGTLEPAFSFEPGLSMPAHAMADGKLLLAYVSPEDRRYIYQAEELRRYTPRTITDPVQLEQVLEAIRLQGYSVDEGERFKNFWGLAVPVLRSQHKLLLAMLCIGIDTLTPERLAEIRAQMESTVEALSDHLALVGDMPRPAVDFARHNLE